MKQMLLLLIAAVLPMSCCNNVPATADILIVGGTVYDGVNDEPVVADIAICGDTIAYIGKITSGCHFSKGFSVGSAGKDSSGCKAGKVRSGCKAGKVIDATGYVVCPGFIDPHNHTENILLDDHLCESFLRMGVTSMIPGQCGSSQYPIRDFFAKLESRGIGPNVASFTGHNTIRNAVMGCVNRHATDVEIAGMQEILRREIADGSLGLSTGLYYVPGCFSESREVLELCRAMSDLGGIYTTHVRNENKDGIGLYNSIVEALEFGKQAGVQVNISHIKCLGKSSWFKSDSVISVIEKYQKEGLKVTADQYPYLASGLSMSSALTPSWARDGGAAGLRKRLKDPVQRARIKAGIPDMMYERGGAETIYISRGAGEYSRMTLARAAAKMGVDASEAVLRLVEDPGLKPYLNTFIACDSDLENFMVRDWVFSCTDGSFGSHPRAAGTYAELIQKYVVGKKVLTLSRFIRRSTSRVAQTYGLSRRGVLRRGAFADIVIFRPGDVRANATYTDPKALSTGFKTVIVNGTVAVEDDVCTGALAGRVLRKEK